MQETSAVALRKRLDDARILAARLHGMKEADERQLREWTEKVSAAKARRDLSEEVTRVFEAMQNRAHSRSVGTFERLLSAVLQDVLPDKGNIRFELSNSRNAPNLDIYVDNGGSLEDVLEGSGGAVTNVISAGLRFAALTRTKNRRLMVLDEPDCWIKPARVPNFIRVISDVANTTGTQTLLISHHDPAYFRGRVNLIELTRDEAGQVIATPLEPQVTKWESDAQPGIRSIQLINFRAHADTTLKLFPGVNALIGDNDLGKSTALVASLKAVGYNDSDDTVIRHGAKQAQVIIELENGRRLEWTRKAKGSPKVVYALYEAGNDKALEEGKAPGRGSVPDWVVRELGITEVDKLDIQVGSQKNPVFLLDQPPPVRAQLLSVGRESGHLTSIMDLWGEIKRKDNDTIKEGELRVTKLTYRLERLERLAGITAQADLLAQKFAEVEAVMLKKAALTRIVKVLTEEGQAVRQLSAELAILNQLPAEAPVLTDTTKLRALCQRIERGLPFKNLALPELKVEVPELKDTAMLKRLIARISLLSKFRPLFDIKLMAIPEVPVLQDQRHLTAYIHRRVLLSEQIAKSEQENTTAIADLRREEAEEKALKARLGGVCPLCDHRFEEEEEGHVHATME
jgi:hypothetical protein